MAGISKVLIEQMATDGSPEASAGNLHVDDAVATVDLNTAVHVSAAMPGIAADEGAGRPVPLLPVPNYVFQVVNLVRELLVLPASHFMETIRYLDRARPLNWDLLRLVVWEVLHYIP